MADGLRRVQPKAETLSTVPVAAIEPNGERELVLRTRTPFAPLPAFLVDDAGVILAPSAFDEGGAVVRPVATGPYRVTALDGTKVIDVETFDGYWGAKPAITRVRMLTMNLALPLFADVRVRRALSLAIDRAGIVRAILRDPASAATQLLPPVLSGWYDPSLPPLVRDPAEARRLFAGAGWQPGPDGVLARDGQRMAFSMLAPGNRPEIPVIGQAVQAELREVGVAVDLRPGPSNAIPAAARDGTLQAALLARSYVGVPDPIGTLLPDYASDATVWASTGYRSPEMRKLMADDVADFDAASRPGLRASIAALLQRDLPVIPVAWTQHNAAVSTRLDPASVSLDPFETSYRLPAMRWAA